MWPVFNNNGILETPVNPKYEPDRRGFGAFCFNKMKTFSNNVAQIDAETNETQTYGEILENSIRCALKLKFFGITENDIISLCTNTHKYTCVPYWATLFLGAKIANLDPTLSLNEIKHLISLVKPRFIFCIPESIEMLEKAIQDLNLDCKLCIFGSTEVHIPFDDFLQPQDDEEKFKPKVAENLFDVAIILFSSGTTGLPKAICLTHYGVLGVLNLIMDFYNLETSLYYTSPYWISYLILTGSILLCGGKRIISKTFEANKIGKLIQDFKTTFLFIPPSYSYAICNSPENYKYDTSSVYAMMLGGSTTSLEQIERIQKLFPNTMLSQLYGLTEITAVFSGFNPKDDIEFFKTKVGSSGKMIPGTQCKILDLETNELVLAPYQRGELLIKTKRYMKGYYQNEEATKDVFDEDGFLHTGDVVYYDEDYCFYIVDRIKEMFKYKSWHIVPAELEAVLIKHPAVKEVIVIGYPHEEDGDYPMAFVVPKENVNVTETEMLDYFNEQVPERQKLRGGLRFVKSLPKTATGKYSRLILRNLAINNEI